MAGMSRSTLGNSQIHKTQDSLDRLRRLYPAVIDPENTLPRSWSPKDKHNFIGLTQNDLRVHYKGRAFHSTLESALVGLWLAWPWLGSDVSCFDVAVSLYIYMSCMLFCVMSLLNG